MPGPLLLSLAPLSLTAVVQQRKERWAQTLAQVSLAIAAVGLGLALAGWNVSAAPEPFTSPLPPLPPPGSGRCNGFQPARDISVVFRRAV